jgi:hypothetical protein
MKQSVHLAPEIHAWAERISVLSRDLPGLMAERFPDR